MMDLIAAEWLKLRTTRLLLGMIPAVVAISLAAVAGTVLTREGGAPLESSEGIRRALSVTGSGAILVLVLGILISAGEHRHGTAADTFLTTPLRHQVLIAKLAVGAGVGLAARVSADAPQPRTSPRKYSLHCIAIPSGTTQRTDRFAFTC